MYKVTYIPEGKYQGVMEPTEQTFRDLVAATGLISKLHINCRENDLEVGRDYNIIFEEV